MNDILMELSDASAKRVSQCSRTVPLEKMRDRALLSPAKEGFPFEAALRKEGMSFICEIKRASPSKGVIAEDFDHIAIAREYESAGASCISVLTEPTRFLGDIGFLKDVSEVVDTPLLRKDFIVDEYQIYEARANGASAVLLIVSILDEIKLKRFIELADGLGLSSLVEVHDESEVETAIRCGARIVGVNNRNLHDFTVDPTNCLRLRSKVPKEILFVAESGIKTDNDVKRLYDEGVDAVLIGETLMRSEDKTAMLKYLRGSI
jgi:indole-3-glycerol phosphate synthase